MNLKSRLSLNTFNIFTTLILGIVSLIISINSYRVTERQAQLIERQSLLEEGQLQLELKNAILELMNVSSTLSQEEQDYPDIRKSVKALNEMKAILDRELKNKLLFEDEKLSGAWTELLIGVNFNIKLFETGLSPNVKIDGAYNIIRSLNNKSKEIFDIYNL